MLVIDYDPSLQIPPICEDDINTKIVVSIYKESNIFIATKITNNSHNYLNDRMTWYGCFIDDRVSYMNSLVLITSHTSDNLISLLIHDYKRCAGNLVYYILEDIFDVEFIANKYNLRERNLALLRMLQDRAKEVFARWLYENN